ncbi:MAG: hypothetical protein EPO35_07055 [Acidobacteria bacterium]|nr:MAG: hypothetical protein EPO35_07055 [Acidobacteriota bacterium]
MLSKAALVAVAVAAVWTPQTSGVTARLRGVSATSDKVAFASGSGGTVLRTRDGGATWTKLTLPADAARLDFRDVDVIDARTVYILSIGAGNASRIYKSTDGGETWNIQFSNADPKGFYDAMSFWDANHGIVFGDSIGDKLQILLTSDGGLHWDKVPDSALPPALENEGAFAGSGTNIAVFGKSDAWIGTGAGPKCRIIHTADRGKTWSAVDTPIAASSSAGIFSVAFRDKSHGVTVGGDYRKEKDAVDNVAITSDGGRTWTLVKEKGLSGFRSVVKFVPGTKSTVVAVGPQGADISEDDGRTWTPIEMTSPLVGFDTLSFAPGKKVAFGAGNRGAIGKLEIR